MNVSEFVLKATPPRMTRAALERAHLRHAWDAHHDRTVFTVVAPAGFGKTTLLLQWRRWWLEMGVAVAWLTAGDDDLPARFSLALAHALRVGSVLDDLPADHAAGKADAYAHLTRLLAAVAELGTPVCLVIDEAERLPEESVRGPLQYLLLNAPANLHVAIGTRVPLPLLLSELVAKGQCGGLGTEDLRLRLSESIEILVARLGDRISLDDRAHLHDATEGWPIGLQLAISAIEREPDAQRAVRSLSARHGTLQEYFVTSLFSRLPPDVATVLVRASILEHFDAQLFQAVTGCRQPQAVLDRLVRETPLMTTGEHTDWMRLHPLARDFLLSRFEALSPREQSGLHGRASRWYAERERFHEAALHALAAGDEELAQSYAARSLWALSTIGKVAEAREWLDRLPAAMLTGDTELRLVAASVLALGERNAEAIVFAREVLGTRRQADSGKWLLLAAIGTLMLLFMTLPALNLINLNTGRILERSAEIGVRKAFGASSRQLVWQFVVENVLLCIAGGVLGLVFAKLALVWLENSGLIPYLRVDLDFAVFGWGLLLAIVFGLLSGVIPAWKMSRLHPVQALKGAV